jgi:hypothetical protein
MDEWEDDNITKEQCMQVTFRCNSIEYKDLNDANVGLSIAGDSGQSYMERRG